MSKTEAELPWYTKTNSLCEVVVGSIFRRGYSLEAVTRQGSLHDKHVRGEGNATFQQTKVEAGLWDAVLHVINLITPFWKQEQMESFLFPSAYHTLPLVFPSMSF